MTFQALRENEFIRLDMRLGAQTTPGTHTSPSNLCQDIVGIRGLYHHFTWLFSRKQGKANHSTHDRVLKLQAYTSWSISTEGSVEQMTCLVGPLPTTRQTINIRLYPLAFHHLPISTACCPSAKSPTNSTFFQLTLTNSG